MRIGIYDVQLKEYHDPYLARWTWIEAYKNGRKVKRLETLEKLSKEYFKQEGDQPQCHISRNAQR